MRTALSVCRGVLLSLCVLLTSRLGAAGFQAGAAKAKITPEGPIRLSGYGSRTAAAEGVDEDLYARALVLKDEDGVLTVFLSVDAIGLPLDVRDDVIGELRSRTGIYHVRLAACATHSHYAPVIEGAIRNIFEMTPEETKAAKEYTSHLVKRLVKAIDDAMAHLGPAEVLHGQGEAGFAQNRRTKGGPVDHSVPVLAVRGADSELKAVMYAYACHATTIPAELNRICGDWPGYSAEALEAAHPGAVALPVIGCGGDANPTPRGELALSKKYGRELAEAVDRVLAGPLRPLPARIDAQLETVQLRFASVPSVEELGARLGRGPPQVARNARLLLDDLQSRGRIADTYSYPVQVITFGKDLAMVFLAGEVVVDYAIRLRKELAPRELWITGYANDIPGYIASKRVLAEGGYEADDSMVWYGRPSRWDDSVEDLIVEKVKSLLPPDGGDSVARMRPPPAKSPAEALAAFRLPEGLRIELAACEPQVSDPVQIAFDERGRMYAAEMRDYPEGPGAGKPADGRVRLLEDRDGDGGFETSSVFAEAMPFANGIACSEGGVFVTTQTELFYLKDTDEDLKADVRKVIYSGFGPGNSQHLSNTIQYGPDGWMYVNGGDRAVLHCVAKDGVADLKLSHQSFRFRPTTFETQITTGYRGGFGMAFDDRGARFVVDNQNHAVHVVFERQDLERAKDVRVDDTQNEISDHGARIFPASKALERYNDPQDYGRFSSACGVHIYRGDALPERYRGNLFVCEPVSNLVHRDVLAPSGASYVARRGEEGTEILASTDHWFRPVNCTTGPDGALYVVDMYREVIEHPEWIPEHVKKKLDLRAGMDRGRIWRIVGAGFQREAVDLSKRDAAGLAPELESPNGWRRTTARRLLVERGGDAALSPVERVLASARSWAGRVEALWTLSSLGKLSDGSLEKALADEEPAVRAVAVRQLAGRGFALAKLRDLSKDADAHVRFQAALAAGSLDAAQRASILAPIAFSDAVDPWTRWAVLLSSGRIEPILAAVTSGGRTSADRLAFVQQLFALLGARRTSQDVAAALDALFLDVSPDYHSAALTSLLEALPPGSLPSVLEGGRASADIARVLSGVNKTLATAAARARDDSADLAVRVEAVELVGRAGLEGSQALLAALLDPQYAADLQITAVRGLARLKDGSASKLLVEAFRGLTPRVRSEIVDALLRSEAGLKSLLDAIETGQIRPQEIDLPHQKALLESNVSGVRDRAAKALASVAADPNRAGVIERYRQALASSELKAPADLRNGEALFLKSCAICHRVGDKGIPVGADLSGMRNREPESLLVDILDPNRAVAPEFINYTCLKKDGQLLTGLLASETPSSIVLRRSEGKTESVLRRDLAELKPTGESVMPQGLESQLDPKGMRDVIAYVRGGFEELERATLPDGASSSLKALAAALTFHASFDTTADADFARGDSKVSTGKELGVDGKPGLTTGNVAIVQGKGRHAGALEFKKKDELFVFYRAEKNVAYSRSDWSGTVSIWMSLDPDADLAPGYCDPINLTQRGWNDGAFFVDFSKDDKPRHFRLGAFADRDVWDPKKREWDDVPVSERPMVEVAKPPFARGKWTHVVFTWSHFNSGKDDGVARLFLNGELLGALSPRRQTFTWDPAKTVLQIGMFYTGLLDDLAVFDRALTDDEVRELGRLEGGVRALGVK